jgi:Alginate O-acetyl transferase AlgF
MRTLSNIMEKIIIVVFVIMGLFFSLALTTWLVSSRVQADESALYDEAPEGSAYIRLINLTSSPINAGMANKILTVKNYCYASEYVYLPGGEYTVNNQAVNWRGDLQADKAYSLIVTYAGARLKQEQRFSSVRKGLLAVYNFSSHSISVRTAQGNKPVFGVIESDTQKSREVNPLKIQLSVHTVNEDALNVAPVIFQSGVISSLLVCRDGMQVVAHWSNN